MWSTSNGSEKTNWQVIPTRRKLEYLGLKYVADELEKFAIIQDILERYIQIQKREVILW